MRQPFEPPPSDAAASHGHGATSPEGAASDALASEPVPSVASEEIVAAADPARPNDPSLAPGAEAPLREIAHAFRLNAEALHTLKQMQGDLAASVKRGDRSELVVQSTRALNETFRNLTGVQRELLSRLHQNDAGRRGPLIPLMLLGLLVVLLGGVYVILDAVEKKSAVSPGMDPAELARRERDSWKEGRREGAQHSDREVQRLQEGLREAKDRSLKLQAELDQKLEQVAEVDRSRRIAEMERDEFAGQVRRAQNEVVAKKTLEDEVGSLRLELDAANKVASKAEHDLSLQRSKNAFLRERLADHGMGIPDDDPPWRPGVPAGTDPATGEPFSARLGPKKAETADEREIRLLIAGRKKMGLPFDDLLARTDQSALAKARGASADGASASAVPPPAAQAADERPRLKPTIRRPDRVLEPAGRPTNLVGGKRVVPTNAARQPPADRRAAGAQPAAAKSAGGAARGGDVPGARPVAPPSVQPSEQPSEQPRVGAAPAARPATPEAVRARINQLLAGRGSAGWQVTRIGDVSRDALGSVIMTRYDSSNQRVESIEAKDVRIAYDRRRGAVEFTFRDGLRSSGGVRSPLPPKGMPLIVAQGAAAKGWSGSGLPAVQQR